MAQYYDIYESSLKKRGEELCGDQVKIHKGEAKTIVVLSDGLGSGVKANILATLTTEIVSTMMEKGVPFKEVVTTVLGTLPICKIRKLAYATFTVAEIDEKTNHFRVINFDNPPLFLLRQGRVIPVNTVKEKIMGKEITLCEGVLEPGDFLGVISDGVLYAGMGGQLNFGWGWDQIAEFLENLPVTGNSTARDIVDSVMEKTSFLYDNNIGDDATFVGVYVRERKSLVVFTGPPLEKNTDSDYVKKFLGFQGRKVICGGTTANIVAGFLGKKIETDIETMNEEVPPIGFLEGVDLVSEGILTLSRSLNYLRQELEGKGERSRPRNGAALLAGEFLKADYIHFMVGQTMNPFYQNPLLPKNMSIRTNLVYKVEELLLRLRKKVSIEFC